MSILLYAPGVVLFVWALAISVFGHERFLWWSGVALLAVTVVGFVYESVRRHVRQ